MNPAWIMVAIAAAGIIFQGGIGWAVIGRMNKIENRLDDHADDLSTTKAQITQHEWRITSHDQRLHTHEEQLDRLRSIKP